MIHTFSISNFRMICDKLASTDTDLASIIQEYGYPPMWSRPNTFETLLHIILEQQVSLASALAALNKLKEKIGDIMPGRVLLLSDEEMKSCYFSRQKTAYVKYLASELLEGRLDLRSLEILADQDVRARLISLKGIGNWTIDVYLIFVLHRVDIFPVGDLAAVNAMRQIKAIPKEINRELLLQVVDSWRPYRSIATMLLWHHYLSSRKPKRK